MTISFAIQQRDATLPLRVTNAFTASQLPLDLVDVPETVNASPVTAINVTVTNANGNTITGAATKVRAGFWRVVFASSNFETYGFVSNGVKVVATVTREDGSPDYLIIGIGDINIKASNSSATPGSTRKTYEERGADIYVKSRKVGGVQHYVKQVASYDAQIGWGVDWTGDYILANGEFVPANNG